MAYFNLPCSSGYTLFLHSACSLCQSAVKNNLDLAECLWRLAPGANFPALGKDTCFPSLDPEYMISRV